MVSYRERSMSQGCFQPEEEEQSLVEQRSFGKQGWKRSESLQELTVSLLRNCEQPDCAKRTCTDICGGAAIVLKVCTNWICRFYNMTRACTEVLVEDPELPHVTSGKMVAFSTTPPECLSIPYFCLDEEVKSEVAGVLGGKSHIPGLSADNRLLTEVSRKHKEVVHNKPPLLSVRRPQQIEEELICVFTSGNSGWKALSLQENSWIELPYVSVEPTFNFSDKDSITAGNHLLWMGKEVLDSACYKYDHALGSWERGPYMLTPRFLFGSATCGQYAYVAGGVSLNGMLLNVLNSAERYNSRTGSWEPLTAMRTPRQRCSAFFMDGKLYVIGGKSRNYEQLTCGEEYDPATNVWRTIDNMYLASTCPPSLEPSPPLVAVAGNELYAIDTSRNLLTVYEKVTNCWRPLGLLPVRADVSNGWFLAFKGVGDRLFLIGGQRYASTRAEGMSVFACKPQSIDASEWQLVSTGYSEVGKVLLNCAVMSFKIET